MALIDSAVTVQGRLVTLRPVSREDNLGSTAVTTNGTVAESRAWYNPFGELYSYWGTIPTDKRFTGQQREYETEPPNQWNAIYDYGARMYDAKIGRMLQPDAFYDPYNPQSLNRYSYALNNPTTYTDPTGMYPIGIECTSGCPLHPEHPGFESWAIANHPEWISCDNVFGGCSADFPDWTGDAGQALERKWTIEPLMDWRYFTSICRRRPTITATRFRRGRRN